MHAHAVLRGEQLRHQLQQLVQASLAAHLALELRIQAGGEIKNLRLRLVHHAIALEERGQRQVGIVEQQVGRKRRPQLAAQAVAGAGAAEAGINAHHLGAHPQLVAPVEVGVKLLVRLLADDAERSAGGTDFGIAEVGDQFAQALRVERLARVGEHHDLAGGERDGGVQCFRLAIVRHALELHAFGGEAARDLVGAVVGAVGDHPDFHQLAGIILREEGAQLGFQELLAVAHRDHDGDGTRLVLLVNGIVGVPRHPSQQQRIAEQRIQDEHDGDDEDGETDNLQRRPRRGGQQSGHGVPVVQCMIHVAERTGATLHRESSRGGKASQCT